MALVQKPSQMFGFDDALHEICFTTTTANPVPVLGGSSVSKRQILSGIQLWVKNLFTKIYN
jgi:hypothetical protein